MQGKHLAIGTGILALVIAAVLTVAGNVGSPTPEVEFEITAVAEEPTLNQVIKAYKANNSDLLYEYYKAYGGDDEWNSFGAFLLRIKEVSGAIDRAEETKEREATLGTWQDAVKSGVVLKEDEPDEDGDIAKYFDVTEDGIADFQICFSPEDKPVFWRYLDKDGEGYG